MTLETLLAKIDKNPELTQAFTRIMITDTIMITLFFAQFLYTHFATSIFTYSIFYFLFSLFWFVVVDRQLGSDKYRRIVGMAGDLGALSYGIHTSSIVAMGLYPLVLWVIVVNGFRYGREYLYIALAMALVFFQIATFHNPAWQSRGEVILMLSLGMLGLPLLFSHLLKQMGSLDDALIEKAEDLEYRLYHDSMTTLHNREALNKTLLENDFYALTLIDINNFSHFNDLYGMEVGNTILKNLATFLQKTAKKEALKVFRISGDAFVLLQQKDIEAEVFDQKIIHVIEALNKCKMTISNINMKVNFTIVTVKERENTLEKANMTLHFARQKGEKYWVYHDTINRQDEVENILYWEQEIDKAIQEDRIVPVFQPIVNNKGEIVKYETLMRLQKQVGNETKLIGPIEFLDIAMKTNQYEALTTIMIEKSFKAMRSGTSDFSINLTFSNIQNKEMVMFLKSQIDRYDLGERLILEIVESEDIYNFEIVKTFVSYLRLLGVRFAIDDFGSGYSNYMHLFEVQPEYIKIDGSLIQSIDTDENAQKFVASIVSLAQNLGTKIIAEFVHNKAIFDITNALGVDEFQGSYFYKPQTLDIIEKNKKGAEDA